MKTGAYGWGFDYSYVLLGGHQGPPYFFFENNRVAGVPAEVRPLAAGPLNGGAVPVAGPGLPDWDSRQVGQTLVEKTIAFIERDQGRPFYVHLSTDGAWPLHAARQAAGHGSEGGHEDDAQGRHGV